MRTIRLLAVASPVSDYRGGQPETLYAVASDETLWVGEWQDGKVQWKEIASIPQPESPDAP